MNRTADVIVIGLGAMGAAVTHLANQKQRSSRKRS